MLWRILINASHLYCCWCQVTYEFDVQGEAQHGYYVDMNIGYPSQNVKLIIDTGSANFAVAVIPPISGSNNYFHYSNSVTFKKVNLNITIQYVQGNWSGFLATDLLNVSKNHSVRCAISCMTSTYNVFDVNSRFFGILGLGYASLAKPNSSILPFFDTVRQSQNVKNVFSLSLSGPIFTRVNTSSGKLHLGFISTRHYTDEIIYSPIMKEEFFEIILTMIKVGSKQVAVDCKELNDPRSFVDTGTTQLLVPKFVYNQIISKIKNYIIEEEIEFQNLLNSTENINQFWLNDTAACFPKKSFNISFFPDLSISFYHTDNSSFDIVITPELYLLPWQNFSVENTCFTLGIGISNFGTIIGSTLLKGYYVIFDRTNKQIGFANSSFWQNNIKFKSFVTVPSFLDGANYSSCKYFENSDVQKDSTTLSAGILLLFVLLLMLTVLLLYKIFLWVQVIRFQLTADNHSDTNSLVSEEYKMS